MLIRLDTPLSVVWKSPDTGEAVDMPVTSTAHALTYKLTEKLHQNKEMQKGLSQMSNLF